MGVGDSCEAASGTPTRRQPAGQIRDAAILVALLVVAFLLRLVELPRADLGMDGGLSLAMAELGPKTVLQISARDVHPPLFYLLLHLWMLLAGATPLAAKYLPTIFSLLNIAVAYSLGRQLLRPRLGLLVAALMAVSPVWVGNAALLRDFVAAGFFATLSTFIFLKLLGIEDGPARAQSPPPARGGQGRPPARLEAPPGRGGLGRPPLRLDASAVALWVAFCAINLAGVLTSYLIFGVLAAQGLYVLLRPKARRKMKRWLVALAGIGAAYAPWAWLALTTALEQKVNLLKSDALKTASGSPFSTMTFLADVLHRLTLSDFSSPDLFPFAAVFVLVSLAGLTGVGRKRRNRRGDQASADAHDGYLVLALCFSLALTYAIVRFWLHDALPSRYLVVASPFFLLLVARGLDSLADIGWPLAALTAAVLILGSGWGLHDFYRRPPLPPNVWNPTGMVEYVDGQAKDGEALIFTNLEQAGYYDSLSRRHLEWYHVNTGPAYLEGDLAERVRQVLPVAVAKHDALWLVSYQNGYSSNAGQIKDWLDRNAYLSRDEWISDGVMRRYVSGRGLQRRFAPAADFGGAILLKDVELDDVTFASGDVRLNFYWQSIGKVGVDYTVFVHFMDGVGKRWTQFDAPPPVPTSVWQPGDILLEKRAVQLSDDLPTGDYWIDVGLYSGERRLPVAGRGDSVRLGPVHVN